MVVRAVKRGAGLPISSGLGLTTGTDARSRTASLIYFSCYLLAPRGKPCGDGFEIKVEFLGERQDLVVPLVFEIAGHGPKQE
jgi:hypothetical protein